MTGDGAAVEARRLDDLKYRSTIISNATGAQTVAGMAAVFIVGVVEPQNTIAGLATGSLFKGAAKLPIMPLKRMYQIYQSAKTYKKAIAIGAAEGFVSAAAVEPLNRYSADIIGEDYTLADSAFNVLTSTAFGALFRAGGRYLDAKEEARIISDIDNALARLVENKAPDPEGARAVTNVQEKALIKETLDAFIARKAQAESALSDAERMNAQIYDEIAALPESTTPLTLPKDLSGAKPRYKENKIEFESDIDKALYITAQTKPSKRDADYRQFLRDAGYTDAEINARGREVREKLKQTPPKNGVMTVAAINKKNAPNPRAAELKKKITGPDQLEVHRQNIQEAQRQIDSFPPDEQMVPAAREYVRGTLEDDTPLIPEDNIEFEENIADVDDMLLDEVDALKEQVENVPESVKVLEEKYNIYEDVVNAAYFCLSGR